MVKGCDASVLISSKPGHKELAEKDAEDNKELAVEAFDSVNKAKALVESKCPGVVSCADILAMAARDFVHLVSIHPKDVVFFLFLSTIIVLRTCSFLSMMVTSALVLHKNSSSGWKNKHPQF